MKRAKALLLSSLLGCISTQAVPPNPNQVVTSQYQVSSGGIALQVWATGPGDAPVTLLGLSGGPGLSHDYLDPLQTLAGPRLQYVTFDQRAVGSSGTPPLKEGKPDPKKFTLDDYVADVDAVVRSTSAPRVHLLGHSWGGFLAMAYAARHPDAVSSLILVSSLVPDSKSAEVGVKRLGTRIKQLQAQGLIPNPIPSSTGADCMPNVAAKLPAYLYNPSLPVPTELKNTKCRSGVNAATFDALGDFDITAEVARLKIPVLVIAGENDPFGPEWPEDIARALKQAQLTKVLVPNCGHFPFNECAQPSFNALESFLAPY